MEGKTRIDLDKLPIKRLDAIDESGNEHFPPEIDHEEKRLNMIRRIDFSSVVERDAKKPKSSKEAAASPWPWQSLVENLQLAHQELQVIMDLINTVEVNDTVTVAGMQRPKQLLNENLSDLAVSVATKLQRLRHLGRYFKQSSKALEQQVAREARFYGSLIRLQQNWKVKRHRLAAAGPGSEGFTFDLLDNSISDLTPFSRPSSVSTVRVDHDSAGILAVQLPLKLCRSICLGYFGTNRSGKSRSFMKTKMHNSGDGLGVIRKEDLTDEDVNECVKKAHSNLREIHQSIFQEQVFDMVNRETYNPSPGVNVTGMREDFLQLAIDQKSSVYLCLEPSRKEDDSQSTDSTGQTQNEESGSSYSDPSELMVIDEKHDTLERNLLRPNPVSLEIYLQYIFHENVLIRSKEKCTATRVQASNQLAGDGYGILGHFCATIAHRIFSSRVLSVLELLVSKVAYLHLLSHPTWHSRTSSWSLSLKVPQSILHTGSKVDTRDVIHVKSGHRSEFHTNVLINGDQISVSGEGVPNITGSFIGGSSDVCSINCYGCVLEDLPMILLQQIASQVVHWLYEEALMIGMKASKDFLGLYLDLDHLHHGETIGLVAHIDPHDLDGCISWWLLMDDTTPCDDDILLFSTAQDVEPINRRFLGHLSLEALYSILMDLVNLCSSSSTRTSH